MGIRLPSLLLNAKQVFKMHTASSKYQCGVPKGHIEVYVGDTGRKRFVVPISYLNHPYFSALLKSAEEEFGFKHPTGSLTIPCREDVFINLTSRLQTFEREKNKNPPHIFARFSSFFPCSLE